MSGPTTDKFEVRTVCYSNAMSVSGRAAARTLEIDLAVRLFSYIPLYAVFYYLNYMV